MKPGEWGPLLPAWCLHLQGFAPSATISIRREERLMSLWSLCATNAQCMSLDLTQATFAEGEAGGKWVTACAAGWRDIKGAASATHLCTGRPSESRTAGSPSSASTGCWSRASCSWRSESMTLGSEPGRAPCGTHPAARGSLAGGWGPHGHLTGDDPLRGCGSGGDFSKLV